MEDPAVALEMITGFVLPAGVPASVAVPFPLSVKLTPLGSVPVAWRAGVGTGDRECFPAADRKGGAVCTRNLRRTSPLPERC